MALQRSQPAEDNSTAEARQAGASRATILLASLGPELAARVLTFLDDRTVEIAMAAMANLGKVGADERDTVIAQFEQSLHEDENTLSGGMNAARRLLESAVGPERADRLLERIVPGDMEDLRGREQFDEIVRSIGPASLAALFADEHPQVVALLASHLPAEATAEFLNALPRQLQAPVAARLVDLSPPSPVALEHLKRVVMDRLHHARTTVQEGGLDGARRVADILAHMRRSKEVALIEELEKQAPAAAEKVNLFRVTVEQVLALDGQALQRILRDLDPARLPALMKGLDETQQETLFTNMSERAAERLREELSELGAVKLRDIETAKQALTSIARDLGERGEIRLREEPDTEEEEDA